MDRANIDRRILRPIGLIMIGLIGLLGVFFYFNKILIGILFGFLIIDSILFLINKEE